MTLARTARGTYCCPSLIAAHAVDPLCQSPREEVAVSRKYGLENLGSGYQQLGTRWASQLQECAGAGGNPIDTCEHVWMN